MTGEPPVRASARTAWSLALAGAALSYVLLARAGPALLHGLSDEALLVPLARGCWDGTLYAGDRWLALAQQVFSVAYSWLLGAFLLLFDDPVLAQRVLGFPFLVVFLAGSFRVAERAAGFRAGIQAVAALALVPHLVALVQEDAAWPLAAGAALPRDLVFALLPWLWLAHGRVAAPTHRARRLLLFAAAGALSVVHPLTALHAVLLLAAVGLLQGPSWRALGDAALDLAAGLLGLVPYLGQWLAFPRTEGSAPRDALLARIGGIGAVTPSIWAAQMETALWLGAAALVLGRRRGDAEKRALRVALVVALVLAALSPLGNLVVAGLQLDRLARVAVWVAVVLGAVETPAAARAKDRLALGLAFGCVVAALAGPFVVSAATRQPRGVLEWAVRRVEVRLGREAQTAAPLAEDRPRPGEPSRSDELADAFREVCAFVRSATPPGALVAVPPEDWGAFRAYAVRGTVVTRKEGGFAMTFLGGRGAEWLDEYRAAVLVYAARDPARWEAWSRARGFSFAVFDDPATPLPAGWTELRSIGPYRVVRAAP